MNTPWKRNNIMKSLRQLAYLRLLILVVACDSITTSSVKAVDLNLGTLKVNKILFLGNSMTYHPAKPEIKWTNNCGMAASNLSKDFVHVLTDKIALDAGGMPTIQAVNIADAFEVAYNTCNPAVDFASQIAFQPNVIVLAVGENVEDLNTTVKQTNYANAFANLLSVLKQQTNAAIFVRSCFWVNQTKDNIMEAATLAAGEHYVDISTLDGGFYSPNRASGDPTSPYNTATYATFNGHPGDIGMAAIADGIYGSMVAASTPEPSTMVLAVSGLLGLLAYAWRKWK
jgi:hypothetical protein